MRIPARLLPPVLALALALPASASAHARLEATTPERGAQLDRAPQAVTFAFNEGVEGNFGALRVFDSKGERVDTGDARHPGGSPNKLTVGLEEGLRDGSYTATFRAVSADGHPVSGGFVFTVGTGGAGPAASVGDLIDAGEAGPVSEVAFGAVRALGYLAIALAVGGVLFLLAVWLPAIREVAGAQGNWGEASEAFAGRLRRLLVVAVGLGLATSALGIVLQGATADGTSFWDALGADVVSDVLGTRFGTVWGLRMLAWAVLGCLLALPLVRGQAAVLRPASLGADGLAPRTPSPAALAAVAVPLAFLLVSPALAGHATTQSPRLPLAASDVVHILSMSAWIGGLVALVAVLPAATRVLDGGSRTRLLSASIARFSTVALAAVAALLATGVVQSVLYLESFGDLTGTPFGRSVLIKFCLFCVLVGIGAYNRRRMRPRLAALAADGEAPGRAGVVLRRALRSEVALVVAVLGVTAALVSYAPPASLAGGPFAESRDLGPARLELVVDPARVGANEVHLYLFDRRTGVQFDRVKALRVTATLPAKRIGPLPLRAVKAGPGHYTVRRAQLVPGGDWRLEVSARVSEFDKYDTKLEVPVR